MFVLVLSPASARDIKYSQLTCKILDYPQKENAQSARKKEEKEGKREEKK